MLNISFPDPCHRMFYWIGICYTYVRTYINIKLSANYTVAKTIYITILLVLVLING